MDVGLTHLSKDLNDLLDELVEEFIPEGYVLSDKEREVSAEVLGNSTDSILNSSEADIQVTLKTFIVTDIDENQLKDDLKGKSPQEAQKIIGGIRNINSYEFNLTKGIPFFSKVPTDKDKINISIERE